MPFSMGQFLKMRYKFTKTRADWVNLTALNHLYEKVHYHPAFQCSDAGADCVQDAVGWKIPRRYLQDGEEFVWETVNFRSRGFRAGSLQDLQTRCNQENHIRLKSSGRKSDYDAVQRQNKERDALQTQDEHCQWVLFPASGIIKELRTSTITQGDRWPKVINSFEIIRENRKNTSKVLKTFEVWKSGCFGVSYQQFLKFRSPRQGWTRRTFDAKRQKTKQTARPKAAPKKQFRINNE